MPPQKKQLPFHSPANPTRQSTFCLRMPGGTASPGEAFRPFFTLKYQTDPFWKPNRNKTSHFTPLETNPLHGVNPPWRLPQTRPFVIGVSEGEHSAPDPVI